MLKQLSKNVGVAGCDGAFYQFHMPLHMKLISKKDNQVKNVYYYIDMPVKLW